MKGSFWLDIAVFFFWLFRDMTTTLPGTSYFSLFYNSSQMDKFELRLIPDFDGLPTGPSVIEKDERVCKLFEVKEPSMVIPLRFTKRAYAVYQQLGVDADLEEIKRALYMAFWTDPFIA